MVLCTERLIDIQPYVLAQFSRQCGYSQGALGYPSRIRGIIGSITLQDALHAWLFFSAFNTYASFRLLQYETQVYTSGFAEWYSIGRTYIRSAHKDGLFEVGVISKSNADGSIDRDHLDAYVHGAHEWKISLYDDGIDYYAPYSGYKYGVENKSTMASRKRPD